MASVLRPKKRKPTRSSGPAPTIHLARLRRHYTGVRLPADTTTNLPHAIDAWRGIPYAQTTGGAHRFRPPVPLEPYDEDQVADAFGPTCPGSSAGGAQVEGASEDCLNLNVYRPAELFSAAETTSSVKLPVVVYVHGGAFNGGMGVERDMASFVAWAMPQQGLVAVSFNYRVGALGFPSSTAAGDEGCLNLGLKDQRLLFEWVRENIGAFGGDPARVTVMGLSAGAHSIGYHLQAYTDPSTAPFHGAILESGGATARATLSPSHPRTQTQWQQFLQALGLSSSSFSSSAQLFDHLRTLPVDDILRASSAIFAAYQDPIRWPFQPVIEPASRHGAEEAIITDLPITNFRTGAFLRIPILTGFNTHEGAVFCSPRVDTTESFLSKFTSLIPTLTTKDLDALCTLYPDPTSTTTTPSLYPPPPPGFGAQWPRYERAYAHYAYICPTIQTAHFYAAAPAACCWVYHFAARAHPELGGTTNHADEAAVVAREARAVARFPGLWDTSEAMHGAWVRFIASGDPNHQPNSNKKSAKNVPFWPCWSNKTAAAGEKSRPQVMMFGEGNDERMGPAGKGARGTPARVVALTETEMEECRFWWERVELSEGMGRKLDQARL